MQDREDFRLTELILAERLASSSVIFQTRLIFRTCTSGTLAPTFFALTPIFLVMQQREYVVSLQQLPPV